MVGQLPSLLFYPKKSAIFVIVIRKELILNCDLGLGYIHKHSFIPQDSRQERQVHASLLGINTN